MGDLVALRLPSANQQCRCGSEWWNAAVVLDAEDRTVSGYADVTCRNCGSRP